MIFNVLNLGGRLYWHTYIRVNACGKNFCGMAKMNLEAWLLIIIFHLMVLFFFFVHPFQLTLFTLNFISVIYRNLVYSNG